MRLERIRLWIVFLLTLFGLVVLGTAWLRKQTHPPVCELPSADQILEMRASLSPVWDTERVPEFVVPPEHIPNILFWLIPGKYVGDFFVGGVDQGFYFEVAEIVMRTKDGAELRLRCHDWGCNPVAFTANGKDYFLGQSGYENGQQPERGIDGGVRLYLAIKDAHKALRK
jgi:hypothetical protein